MDRCRGCGTAIESWDTRCDTYYCRACDSFDAIEVNVAARWAHMAADYSVLPHESVVRWGGRTCRVRLDSRNLIEELISHSRFWGDREMASGRDFDPDREPDRRSAEAACRALRKAYDSVRSQ